MPAMSSAVQITETEPRTIAQWLKAGQCTLIDVREPEEHAREHIRASRLVPLSSLDPADFSTMQPGRLVFHCRSGRRSADAATQAAAWTPAGVEVHTMKGGIEQWKADAFPVELNASAPRLSVMRQVQLSIGAGVLAGLAIGYFLHPLGYLLSAFMGGGLIMAGLSGACPLASAIAKMPWNRRPMCGCSQGSCDSKPTNV